MMKLKENCQMVVTGSHKHGNQDHALAQGQPVYSSDTFFMQATSAETNVASVSSYLGLPVKC